MLTQLSCWTSKSNIVSRSRHRMGTEILPHSVSPNWPYRAASHWITSNHVVSYLQYCSACQPPFLNFIHFIFYIMRWIYLSMCPALPGHPSLLFRAFFLKPHGSFRMVTSKLYRINSHSVFLPISGVCTNRILCNIG